MKITEEVNTVVDKTVAIKCDFCGKEYCNEAFPGAYDCHIDFAWASERDGTRYSFDICDSCFESIFKDYIWNMKAEGI